MKTKGFTLLEVLLSIIILLILMAFSVISYVYFSKSGEVSGETEHLEALLRGAQGRSISGVSDQIWGIHFEESRYILFKGETYNPADPENQVNPLSSGLSLTFSLSDGGSSIIFERLTGVPQAYGQVTISGSFGQTRTIQINQVGKIERQ